MKSRAPEKTVLKANNGLFSATAIGVGTIIGAGIFVVSGIVAGLAGPAMVISMVIAGAIASFSALSLAELGAYLPQEGGVYIFADKLLSPSLGFIAGWTWIFSNIFVGAAVSLAFAHYCVAIFQPVPVKIVATTVCCFFTLLNFLGIRKTAVVNNLLVLVKIVILLFFVVVGTEHLNREYFTPFAPHGTSGILQGSALIFFAYTGFARITTMAEEVKDPRKNIPRSIILALGISTVIYLLVSFVAIGLVGSVDLSNTGSPLVTAITVSGSHAAILLLSIGAIVATASVLLTTILGVSRMAFAIARNNHLPTVLSRIHRRYKTPYWAVGVSGLLMMTTILLADLTRVVAVSTFASLLYYLLANLAALKLREKTKLSLVYSGYRRHPVSRTSCFSLT